LGIQPSHESLALEAWAKPGERCPRMPATLYPFVSRARTPSIRSRRVNDDFRDVLAALIANGARFLVVDAHAMAVMDDSAKNRADMASAHHRRSGCEAEVSLGS
jgi:hypothetical protein